MVTAPIDCTSVLSNTDLNVVPPLMDFQTPPLAEPAKTGQASLVIDCIHCRNTPTHCGGTYVASRQAGDGGGIKLDGRLGHGRDNEQQAGYARQQKCSDGLTPTRSSNHFDQTL